MDDLDLIVISTATARRGMLEVFEAQVKEAGIEFLFDQIPSLPHNTGNLGWKMDYLSRMVDRFPDRTLVFADAWDVRFYGTKYEVMAKIPKDGVLCAAERNCWPDEYLAYAFPFCPTPWKYFNGGVCAGPAWAFAAWIHEVKNHPAYFPEMLDQQWFNHRMIHWDMKTFALDSRANLFYCMIHEANELRFVDGRPHNTLTDTWPNFLHLNGKYPAYPILLMEEGSLAARRVIEAISVPTT